MTNKQRAKKIDQLIGFKNRKQKLFSRPADIIADIMHHCDNYFYYENLNKEYKAELAKNEELGVELLTLVNQKNANEAEKKNLTDERDGLKKANVRYTYIYIYI